MIQIVQSEGGCSLTLQAAPSIYTLTEFYTGGEEDVDLITIDDAIFTQLTGAEVNYRFGFPLGSSPPEIVNRTLTICEIVGDSVMRSTNGVAQIDLVNGSVTTPVFLNFDSELVSQPTVFKEFVEGSVSKALQQEMLEYVDSDEPDKRRFSTRNHDTATYIRNEECWLPVDLSAIAVGNNVAGFWSKERSGLLITPQHMIVAIHYPATIGSYFRFVDLDGVVHTRQVVGISAFDLIWAYDVKVCLLSAPIPEITPMKIVGEWFVLYDSWTGFRWKSYRGGLGFWVDKNDDIHGALLGDSWISAAGTTFTVNGVTRTNVNVDSMMSAPFGNDAYGYPQSYYGFPVTGDSGSPLCALVNGEPAVVQLFTTVVGGSSLWFDGVLQDLIAECDADAIARGSLISPTGYSVTFASDPTA